MCTVPRGVVRVERLLLDGQAEPPSAARVM